MKRRLFVQALAAGGAMSGRVQAGGATGRRRPNILFILSDDHTMQGFGCYGSRLAKLNPTPVLDKFARGGARFDQVFCNNAICTPSRASIITGQYPQTNRVLDLEQHLPPARQYLPQEMKKAGYQTAMIGKWHLGDEPAAFDYYNVLVAHGQQGSYFDPEFIETGMKFGKHEALGIKTKQYKGHSTDVITDLTIDWLSTGRNKEQPFFLMHHYKAPHDMFENAPRYDDYLADAEIPEPESLYEAGNHGSVATRGENDALIHDVGSSVSKRNPTRNMGQHMEIDPELDNKEYTHLAYQECLKRYLRCVKGIDDNLARLFDYLKKEGLWENTVIFYSGDQGFFLGEHDYIDRRWAYEEGMRMPLIMHYPKTIKPGTVCDALINNTDFAPTMLAYAGIETSGYMQGHSFKTNVETGEEPDDWREATYYRYWMHMAHAHANPALFGLRTKRYKLIFYYGCDVAPEGRPGWGMCSEFQTPPGWDLYDLKQDPEEMNNVYGNPEYAEIAKKLKKLLKQEREALNETDKDYPHIQNIIAAHWDD
ncbi:sulfatase family protein [Pontiella sulfatireligans]|uniref:Arylsulfatase n=1 Tax=Pontiella sulfatireligans TaxID=2750658 RepID=A0A6C2UKT6_9BACT|nr:sulfatase [Pontiella sulfatireligans]SPS74394.1 sulfatase S1_11 [Kiritimatiellales bacterium]VGO19796.1 Arylsulfatase [Pontiella sulfatireligans]